MDAENERDFWDDIPTYSSKRVHVGARSHHGIGESPRRRPVFARAAPGERDPLLVRLCLLAGVGLLLVPVALTLRAGDESSVLRSAPTGGAVALPAGGSPILNTVVVATVEPDTVPVSAVESTVPETAVPDPADAGGSRTGSGAAAAAAPPETAQGDVAPLVCGLPYEVVAGDYWIGIAQKTQVRVQSLLDINNATSATPLYPKRTICLPLDAELPATSTAPAATVAQKASAAATTVPKAAAPPTTVKATAPATTTTTTTLPPRTYSAAEVEAIIRDVWPDELEEEALRIAWRESNFKNSVRNYCCFGLFQIYFNVHKGWLSQIGVTNASQLFDPLVNANAALALYHRNGGWGPWQ